MRVGGVKKSEKKGLSRDNFNIIRQLGEGKSGNVFLAQ